ncbi:hypothetical protein MMC20_007971 [Loxospora ochrophaea]|nr:hypothetical protein [Loxospora ochrophaea]
MANTTETIKFHMARAGVILGLMPTLLSNFGPTPAESSLLMLERPILAVLLAVGSPAMYLSRPFDNYEPLEPLSRPSIRFPAALMTSRAFPVVNIVRYFLATSAAANVITVSLELGRKTVMVWKKPNSYLPLTWALLPVAGHICATIRLWNSLEKLTAPRRLPKPPQTIYQKFVGSFVAKSSFDALEQKYSLIEQEEPWIIYYMSICLPILSLMHLGLGTMIFSSPLFIGVNDTAAIVLRYGVSAGLV